MFSIRVSGKVSYYNAENLKKAQKAAQTGSAFFMQNDFLDRKHGILKQKKEPNKHRKTNKNDFFDRCAQLYMDKVPTKKQFNLITLTLPSISHGIYQKSNDCELTGDKFITANLSRLLESLTLKIQRDRGIKISYVWSAERQHERKIKFGGVGDLHFHIFTNLTIKKGFFDKAAGKYYNTFLDGDLLAWLQKNWCELLNVPTANNCIDVRPISGNMESVVSYIAKYLSKEKSEIPIISKKWSSSKDLVKLRPVKSNALPDCKLYRIHENEFIDRKTGEVIKIPCYYFDSYEIKEKFFKSSPGLPGSFMFEYVRQINSERTTKKRYTKIFKGVKPEVLIKKLDLKCQSEKKEKNYFPRYFTLPLNFYNICHSN
jgi:hypothetical protein